MSGTAIRSMTGFATAEGEAGSAGWRWTLRSVNGRGLDLKLRLPPGFEALEPRLRKADLPLFRGNISAALKIERAEAESRLRVDEEALAVLADAVQRVRLAVECDLPRPEGLLSLGGVLRAGPDTEGPDEALVDAAAQGFEEAVAALAAARAGEGAALGTVLAGHFDALAALTADAAAEAESATGAVRDRLRAQLSELMAGDLPEERLAHEASLLAIKADTREEIDRLQAHIAAGRDLLRAEGAVGRKLEFLCQELAREANTLTTKAPTLALKRTGLDLKHRVDQLREQVLNVE
ncbi:YicC/YloC family endoribonuclease [Parvularcula oceani]|uniref:YicC/YloC family endoribonuclease n=1 Tax=Parvularcula oceani TaxID=1247963 RepID=UPI000A7F0035|nr:YicC/YloC family endoribonuclease [Parvularcula oceani]